MTQRDKLQKAILEAKEEFIIAFLEKTIHIATPANFRKALRDELVSIRIAQSLYEDEKEEEFG